MRNCNTWLEEFKKEEIVGKIEKVELHHWNHNSQYVHIRFSNGHIDTYNFTGTKFEFLEYIRKGDQIFKEEGSLKVKVVRTYPKKRTKYFTIDCWKEGDYIPLSFQLD